MLKVRYYQFVKHFNQFLFIPIALVVGFFTTTKSYGQRLLKNDSLSFSLVQGNLNYNWFNPRQWYNPVEDSLHQLALSLENQRLRHDIKHFSMNFLGKPYRSSGKNPHSGFDCSGFTGFVFKNFGLKLRASSSEQAKEGVKVGKSDATVGDLAFFGKKDKKGRVVVNHAAIVISKPGEPLAIIHSASNKGIVITKVEESRYWKNALLFVKSVL